MFLCKLITTNHGSKILVVARRDKLTGDANVWLCLSKKQVGDMCEYLSGAERQTAETEATGLPEKIDRGGVGLDGKTASVLANFLEVNLERADIFVPVSNKPSLCAFWEPGIGSDFASIMWYHPDNGYHFVIAYTDKQMQPVIESLAWVSITERLALLAKTRKWSIPASTEKLRSFDGWPAAVFCVLAMAQDARRSREKPN